ncbi:hypothetical protein [Pteropox virus]|uniref:Uncharacterized protein n=1 Tax=Pteropox virus TaxID=1873698 RepID=A0A1B1MR97_9POXV|nr:hypothetical protein [Pteropox virus]ANS71094.1 hypothetical protein [Pteropox virus]
MDLLNKAKKNATTFFNRMSHSTQSSSFHRTASLPPKEIVRSKQKVNSLSTDVRCKSSTLPKNTSSSFAEFSCAQKCDEPIYDKVTEDDDDEQDSEDEVWSDAILELINTLTKQRFELLSTLEHYLREDIKILETSAKKLRSSRRNYNHNIKPITEPNVLKRTRSFNSLANI